MVEAKSRVLDVGCGDGTLLRLLAEEKGVDARGIELSQRGVNDCVAKGLSVIQGDADRDRRKTFLAEHRFPRGWTPSGDG